MKLNWIQFGQQLEKGRTFYDLSQYEEAKKCFQQAFFINQDDFFVNFWLARIAIMTGDYTGAQKYLEKCVQEFELGQLTNPWRQALHEIKQGNYMGDLSLLNQRTNKLLDHCYQDREFSLYNFIAILILYRISSVVVEYIVFLLQNFFRIQMTIELISYLYLLKFLCFLLPVAFFYYYKSLCIPNLWSGLCGIRRALKELWRSNSFKVTALIYCIFVMLPEMILILLPELSEEAKQDFLKSYIGFPVLSYLANLLLAPVLEEVLFRGMLFAYIKKYNKLLAYLGTSFLFYYYHGETAVVGHFIGSMIYCWSYEKYGILLAPITLHFLNNLLFLLTLCKEQLM